MTFGSVSQKGARNKRPVFVIEAESFSSSPRLQMAASSAKHSVSFSLAAAAAAPHYNSQQHESLLHYIFPPCIQHCCHQGCVASSARIEQQPLPLDRKKSWPLSLRALLMQMSIVFMHFFCIHTNLKNVLFKNPHEQRDTIPKMTCKPCTSSTNVVDRPQCGYIKGKRE